MDFHLLKPSFIILWRG